MGRRLIYIPIIHSEVDMGSMVESLKRQYIQRYGVRKWYQHLEKIKDLWEGIERRLEEKHLSYSRVKIYQDGLPVCGNELEIVQEIASRGSINHQLILKLVNKGATLVGTEDPDLLMKEYQLIKEGVRKDGIKKEKNYLSKRDAFIVRRIDGTLGEGETGILFLGMLHKVDKQLPPDITVEYLTDHLQSSEGIHERKNCDIA